MKDILKGRKPRGKTRTLKTTLVLAAVLVTLFACAISVTAVRKSVYKFFMSINGNHATVSYESDGALTEIETYYEPSYLPERFEETTRTISGNILDILYSDGTSYIMYSQTVFDTLLVVDAENESFNTIGMSDYEGIYAVDKNDTNQIRIIWNDENYVYEIICNSNDINVDELISIAGSISPVR